MPVSLGFHFLGQVSATSFISMISNISRVTTQICLPSSVSSGILTCLFPYKRCHLMLFCELSERYSVKLDSGSSVLHFSEWSHQSALQARSLKIVWNSYIFIFLFTKHIHYGSCLFSHFVF